jgi:histidine ammonia-lyase
MRSVIPKSQSLAAAQGIDFRRPRKSSAALEQAHAMIRKVAPHLDGDRYLALDIEAVTPLVRNGAFLTFTASPSTSH